MSVESAVSVESPWWDTAQASAYTRRHKQTLYKAARLYQRTKGKRGLRSFQPVPNGKLNFRREDLDRWMEGQTPKRAHAA